MNTQQQAVVKAVQELSVTLTTDGKSEVLAHLTGVLEAKDLNILSREEFTALKSELPKVPEIAPTGSQASPELAHTGGREFTLKDNERAREMHEGIVQAVNALTDLLPAQGKMAVLSYLLRTG